jgi:hypothetical protein
MRLRLLSLIFPSNYPNFAADSIYVFNRILVRSIREIAPDVTLAVAGPAIMPSLDPRVCHYVFPAGVDKFHVRFGFAWDALRKILSQVSPDVILVNMPEQAAAVSVLARDELGLDCRIVSYVHYIPATLDPRQPETSVSYERTMDAHGNGQILILRLLEGLVASDLALVCGEFGVQLLAGLAQSHLGSVVKLPPIVALPPPVDVEESRPALTVKPSTCPRLVYNHRLYNEYGAHFIFGQLTEAATRLAEPFEILVTHPTERRHARRRRLNGSVDRNLEKLKQLPFVQVKHFSDRCAYFEMLGSSWGGIAPYKPNALWSMSVMDVLAAGRPVLAFNMAAFGEMGLPAADVVNSAEAFQERLGHLIQHPPSDDDASRYRSIALRQGGHQVAQKLLSLISA